MRRSIVLTEIILSIALFSIIAVYAMNNILSVQNKNRLSYSRTYTSIEFESARLFLTKHTDFSKLKYDNNVLYYDNNILLSGLISFDLTYDHNIAIIDICSKNNTFCRQWKIRII